MLFLKVPSPPNSSRRDADRNPFCLWESSNASPLLQYKSIMTREHQIGELTKYLMSTFQETAFISIQKQYTLKSVGTTQGNATRKYKKILDCLLSSWIAFSPVSQTLYKLGIVQKFIHFSALCLTAALFYISEP